MSAARASAEEVPFNVLFLCTGNSARSIMAEAILNHFGAPRFRAWSAGSKPRGAVHPMSLEVIGRNGLPIEGYRSKSWDEFTTRGAPPLDFVFTVCDNAAAEGCPIWPVEPISAHWGVPDPAAVQGNPAEIALAFNHTWILLRRRIEAFISLPIDDLDRVWLQQRVAMIGGLPTDTYL
jgi:arsenate reductase